MGYDMTLDVLGTTIKHHMVAAEKHEEKQANHYKSAGIYLKEARTRVEAGEYESPHFSHYLQTYAKMSSTRAYELIAIADGTKTVEGIRERSAESMRKSRASNVADTKQPVDSVGQIQKSKNLSTTKPITDPLTYQIRALTKKLKQLTPEQVQQISIDVTAQYFN